MKSLAWEDFPLPLIQVNPPDRNSVNEYLNKSYESGVFTNRGLLQREASKQLSKNVSVSLEGYLASSNTAALTSCLIAVGVRNRHVLMSNFTFAATLHAIIMAGGIPVLCDVDPKSCEMNVNQIKKLISTGNYDIAAVVPTRVFGFVNDYSDLIHFCKSFKIPVVIDAAATFPAKQDSWQFDECALYEVFSLHATKVFGIGEGGLVVGEGPAIRNVIQTSNFGIEEDENILKDGLNAKADEFTAARALARISEYENDVQLRRKFVEIYKHAIRESQNANSLQDNELTIYNYFPIIFKDAKSLVKFKSKVDPYIVTRKYYSPSISTGYKGNAPILKTEDLSVSESISTRILALPVYVSAEPELLQKLQDLVSSALGELN
jgi:dTDP-4-amino-4,6-dideoxygalactose transaminase